ncbi:MAG: MFS transporter [Candidatus Caldatribacteriota bacterium]|nr:MFS transporter [Candidatus Caldatribacteriota bacterium]
MLIIIAGLASVASSVYYPLGSSIAVNLSRGSKGKSLSIFIIFMTIGGFAYTFAPMISIPIVSEFGLKYLIFLMIPGFFVAFFLKFAEIDKIKCRIASDKKEEKRKKKKVSKNKVKWLSLLVFLCLINVFFERIMIVFGVQIMFMKGIKIIPAGIILSVHMFLRSAGTLSGGYLSDKFGEKSILVIFSILSFGIYTITIFSQGLLVVIGIVLFSYMQNGTSTANITIAHHILPENINLGTGAIMGLPGTFAGILMLVFGKFSDIYGLREMAKFTACLSLIPVFISLYIFKKYDHVIAKLVLVR